ncbi:carboxylic ester hydrolase-like, partial [Armigeres subalbatus]|uniref:carboxylic ester hydrolase-like n=1 Tax=Armigeres subalbatus TaxID=124917 RepID=UPI002ED63B1C
MFTTFLLLVLLGGNTFSAMNPCVVQLNSNTRAVGIRNETFTGTPHCVYLGVRYALPPTGTRRFWNPELYTPSGSQNYTTFGSICPQWEDMSKEGEKPIGDEDCLFMNMYVPKNLKSRQQKYPVLVYLHGGSYLVGSAENYSIFGVDLLIDNEVLVIAVNYRLYVLGFLRVPEWNVTGNFGLKDQRAALQWIQRYIAAFGGDPDRVTLMGHSAGAASAAHHLYSASSRGLFHRLILIGGTNINPFAFRRVEVPNMSEKLKTRFNVSSLEELQRLNVSELYGARILRDVFFFNDVISYFTPNLEDPADPEAVIAESPYELVRRKPANQVPIMMGLTATEMEKIQFKRNEFFVGKKVPMKH